MGKTRGSVNTEELEKMFYEGNRLLKEVAHHFKGITAGGNLKLRNLRKWMKELHDNMLT